METHKSNPDGTITPSPDDPVDPAEEGRVVNRIGPGLSEPEKGTGTHTSPAHAERVGPTEGQRAPHVEELGHAEHSVYDGSGQEVVVVTTTDADGRQSQGSGETAEEAIADAQKHGYPDHVD